jgi:hypothetical protein
MPLVIPLLLVVLVVLTVVVVLVATERLQLVVPVVLLVQS